MTLADFGTIAEIVSAVAVVVTLVYLARQVSQGNKLAQMHTREQMVQMANEELRRLVDDPEMARLFIRPAPLEFADAVKFYNFLVLAMRHREWEWYQANKGALDKADAELVKRYCFEVAGLWLGYRRARNWWDKGGRFGFNPQFAAEIDAYLDGAQPLPFIENTVALEAGLAEEDKRLAEKGKTSVEGGPSGARA